MYDQVDWKVWTHPDGDSFARYWVRLQETREATHIVDQLLDGLPSGPIMAKVPRIIKVPAGEAYAATENPLGEMGYYVVSKGDLVPFRVKIRSASFSNISITPWLLKGVYVPDIITILGQSVLHPGRHRPMSAAPVISGPFGRGSALLGLVHHQDGRDRPGHPHRRAGAGLRVPASRS